VITSLYAGLLGLIYIYLTYFTIKGRFKHRVGMGDGGNEDMQRRIRMHGNFAEYVPFALILIFLTETGNMAPWFIHGLGIALVIGRISHAVGLYNIAPINKARQIGMILTLLVIIIGALTSIFAYFSGAF